MIFSHKNLGCCLIGHLHIKNETLKREGKGQEQIMRGFWTGLLGTNESHLSVELTMYSFNPKYKFLPHRDLDRTDIPQYLILPSPYL